MLRLPVGIQFGLICARATVSHVDVNELMNVRIRPNGCRAILVVPFIE